MKSIQVKNKKDDILRASSEFFSSEMVRGTFLEGLKKKFIKEASTISLSSKSRPANPFMNQRP